jgi:hypothetical protein
MLLGGFDHIWTMGEIYVLPWELQKERGMCGCGKEFTDCRFWAPIISQFKNILELNGYINRFRDNYSTSKFFRFRELMNILFRKSISDKQSLSDFCSANRILFSAVKKGGSAYRNEKISYLVDSSKIFYRLFWLLHCESISTKVIHIVKDPRSFVYSKIKTEKRRWEKLRRTFRMSLRYVIENHLIEKIVRNIPRGNTLLVRYEDLAAHPEKKLEEIIRWLDLTYQPDAITGFRSKQNHGIAGNIMRHCTEGIYLDEKWRQNLGTSLRSLVTVITYFSARKYSYL